jgi:hypothetical protein
MSQPDVFSEHIRSNRRLVACCVKPGATILVRGQSRIGALTGESGRVQRMVSTCARRMFPKVRKLRTLVREAEQDVRLCGLRGTSAHNSCARAGSR